MEIAFHSLLILLFIVFPGVVFRRFFYQGEFSKQYDSKSWYHTLYISAIVGVIVHLITSYLFHNAVVRIERKYFLDAFTIFSDSENYLSIVETYGTKEIKLAVYYSIVLFFVAVLTGILGYWTIRAFSLDIKFSIFRFTNYWHYYFKGEIIGTKVYKNIRRKGDIKFTLADVLIQAI